MHTRKVLILYMLSTAVSYINETFLKFDIFALNDQCSVPTSDSNIYGKLNSLIHLGKGYTSGLCLFRIAIGIGSFFFFHSTL